MNCNRASGTAQLIAAATVMCRADAFRAPPPGAAEWCEHILANSLGGRLLLTAVRGRMRSAFWCRVERLALPGIVSHWMRRKRAIDRLTRDAAREGFRQLVVLGAGLDTLPFRMHAKGTFDHVISADHPATLSIVRPAVQQRIAIAAESSRSQGIELVEIDLAGDDLPAVLARCRLFDPRLDTLFVAEGVLMYLPPRAVAALLRTLATVSNGRRRLVASWMLADPGGAIGFSGQSRWVDRWLQSRGEPMLWASSPESLPSQLAELGWSRVRLIDLAERAADDPVIGLSSEQLFVAED
jgi:methyltransferase (TIGR00027 family)